jgi:serine protease AprX
MSTLAISAGKRETLRRFKIRFRDKEGYFAATALETEAVNVPVMNEKRAYLSLALPPAQIGVLSAENELDDQLRMLEDFGGEIVEDFQYDLEEVDLPPFLAQAEDAPADADLDDVLEAINAPAAWERSRGTGVTIAVVDTGIDGTRQEFPAAKRVGAWQALGDTPWTDWQGHGTMCACIAAGTRAAGGAFDGVAPDAGLIACKTHFYDSELTAVYDYLIAELEKDPSRRIVATNSFGIHTGSPPSLAPGSDFPDALEEAIEKGIAVCFSAGNYHELAGGAPAACNPTSIWLYKCRQGLVTVATCDLGDTMWFYSSRGPGQDFGEQGTARKPDVTAPTPRNGRIVYGSGVKVLPDGWGTSGACPQVAGLAALLISADRSLEPRQVFDAIRRGAVTLGHGFDCEGSGRIDCEASLALI